MAVSIYCPHCQRYTSLDIAAVWKQNDDYVWWIGICNCCNEPVLVLNDADIIYPHPLPQSTDQSVPEDIRADLDEAKKCFAVSAWRGASVMARRAMQSAAIEKGATKKQLSDQVAELTNCGKITLDLKEWADAVRWVGNDAAHPGGQPVVKEDAEEVLKLAEQFLHVLYVAPAIAKKLRMKKGK